jgi:hypothetical protein
MLTTFGAAVRTFVLLAISVFVVAFLALVLFVGWLMTDDEEDHP